jgi:diguanylate cyclase (GGDEF)-like protein
MEPYLMLRFALIAVIGAPAALSVPVGLYFHLYNGLPFWNYALIWALADAVGMSLSLPLMLVLMSPETYRIFRWRALPQTLVLLGGLCAVSWFVFHQQRYPVAYVTYPVLLLVALRLGFGGAVIGANMLAIMVVTTTLNGFGPFRSLTDGGAFSEVVIVQTFCILEVMLVFPLSISLTERSYFERQLRDAYAEMELLATTDKLTSLANRRRFDQQLDFEWQRAIRTRRPLGLLMIDVDFFKKFNDSYGHVAGDVCLQKIAAVLSACTFRKQDLIARYGGEEFAVLLPNAAQAAVENFGQLLCRNVRLAEIPHRSSPSGLVTASVGCALMVPEMDSSPNILVMAADKALYKAKEDGRNRMVVAPSSQDG